MGTIGNERFRCAEALFQPRIIGKSMEGLHTMVYKSITSVDNITQMDMPSSIVLSGGTSLFPGMKERMSKELKLLFPLRKVNVIAPPERKYSSWIGGSILTSLSTFEDM